MVDKNPQESSPEHGEKKKGFWDKTEQISRIFHNIADGSFKLIIIAAIVIALVFGVGVYSKTTSGINTATNWMCEYLNPFCDTEQEAAAKAEEARNKNVDPAGSDRPLAVDEPEDQQVVDKVGEPGIFDRSWAAVKSWFSGDE